MSSERRRRRSRQRRLRRFVSQHRLNAAEGVLACAGLTIGLWLFWPSDISRLHDVADDASPAVLEAEMAGSGAALANGLVTAARANVSLAAQGKLALPTAAAGRADLPGVGPRLAKITRVMPEIGTPATDGEPLAATPSPPAPVADLPAKDAPAEATEILPASGPATPVPKDLPPSAAIARAASALGHPVVPAAALPTDDAPEAEAVATDPQPAEQLAALDPSLTPAPAAPDPSRIEAPAPPHRDAAVPTWVRYAAAAPAAGDQRPMIAIVIDDLGTSPARARKVANLPGPLTMAFLPYASGLPEQARSARAAGHELIVHMPMEPEGSESPGPNALIGSLSISEFKQRLDENLSVFDGFVGLNNHMGSQLTTETGWMALVMAELRRRDLLFVDSRTTSRSVGPLEALRYGVPFAQRDVFLDNKPTLAAVMAQLRRVEVHAQRKGAAIAIGHPNEATIQALSRWLPTLAGRGFRLVPVSSIVARNSCIEPEVASGCGPVREPAPIRAVAQSPS